MNKELQQQNFFKKPEGKTGAVFLVGILGALGYGLYKALPYIITLLENTLYAAGLGLGLFVIIYILMDKKTRTLIWYLYKTVMRKITGKFIELDPIAIIQTYVAELKRKIGIMNEQMGDLRGQIKNLESIIDKNQKEIDECFGKAKFATTKAEESKKAGDMQAYNKYNQAKMSNSSMATRTAESNKNFIALKSRIEKIYGVLDKMRGHSEVMVGDIEHEVKTKMIERNVIRKSHSVMKSAIKIINGSVDEAELFDSAMENIALDINSRIGEMEDFMLMSEDVILNLDLNKAHQETKGLEKLDEWMNILDQKYSGEYVSFSEVMTKEMENAEPEKAQKIESNYGIINPNANNKSSKYF